MGSISHHNTPLVINGLRGGRSPDTRTRIQTPTDRSNSKKPAAGRHTPGLKIELSEINYSQTP